MGVVALDDEFELSVDFSPRAVFGGVVTAIWLYLIKQTGRAFMDWDPAHRMHSRRSETRRHVQVFRRRVARTERSTHRAGTQKSLVVSVPSTGELIAYVEILSILRVGGVFAKARPPVVAFEHIYTYDLQGKSETE